jgi:hypothetical protein
MLSFEMPVVKCGLRYERLEPREEVRDKNVHLRVTGIRMDIRAIT